MDMDPDALHPSRRKSSFRHFKKHENPLLINAVLENLFGLMETDGIKQCRRVCSVWNTEGLRTLRKRVRLNLGTISRQLEFMNFRSRSSYSTLHFKHYEFIIAEWNDEVSRYLKAMQPSSLETAVKLFLNKEHNISTLVSFTDLLDVFNDRLTKLEIVVDWAGTLRLKIPERLLRTEFPALESLNIRNEHIEATWLNPLWIAMISNSPHLRSLELSRMPDQDLWKSIILLPNFIALDHFTFVPQRRLDFSLMNQPISFHFNQLSRLTVPFKEFLIPRDMRSLLSKVSKTLKHLEFITTDQSALSPILFPEMPNLLILDSGKAVLSFPSITPEVFPKLKELRQTYWDWVSALENLPGMYDYWGKNDPHPGVRQFHIRFPDYATLKLDYSRLKKFRKFAWVVTTKFPRARNFTFHNVPLGHDIKRRMGKFFSVFHGSVESFRIASYNPSELGKPNTFEMQQKIFNTQIERTSFQELDLGTRHWPKIWERDPALFSTIPGPNWIPFLTGFPNLRVIRLLWAENLLSLLRLTDTNILSNLEILEFVGDRCVNRWERNTVQRCRPKLRLIQHKQCYCHHEDWWYIYDSKSGRVFQQLFESNN